jgi:hypothetical protein
MREARNWSEIRLMPRYCINDANPTDVTNGGYKAWIDTNYRFRTVI